MTDRSPDWELRSVRVVGPWLAAGFETAQAGLVRSPDPHELHSITNDESLQDRGCEELVLDHSLGRDVTGDRSPRVATLIFKQFFSFLGG